MHDRNGRETKNNKPWLIATYAVGFYFMFWLAGHVITPAHSDQDSAPPRVRVGDIVIFNLWGDDGHSSPAIVLKVWEPDEGRNELDLCVFRWNGGTETYNCVAQRTDERPSAVRGWIGKK